MTSLHRDKNTVLAAERRYEARGFVLALFSMFPGREMHAEAGRSLGPQTLRNMKGNIPQQSSSLQVPQSQRHCSHSANIVLV